MGTPHLRRALAAIGIIYCTSASGEWVTGPHVTASEMYLSCDAVLSGRLVGTHPEVCDMYFRAANMQKIAEGEQDLCMANATVEQRMYVYVSYYATLPESVRRELSDQPWFAIARDAYWRRWHC